MSTSSIKLLAQYNTLANRAIIDAFPNRQFASRHFDCLFFDTPHATINHIAGVTELWLARIFNQPEAAKKFHFLYNSSNDDKPAALYGKSDGEKWLSVCPDLSKSLKWLDDISREAEAKALEEEEASHQSHQHLLAAKEGRRRVIRYFRTNGDHMEASAIDCFTHLFNHGTHHRGQLHASLCQVGVKNCVLDISALIPDFSSPI